VGKSRAWTCLWARRLLGMFSHSTVSVFDGDFLLAVSRGHFSQVFFAGPLVVRCITSVQNLGRVVDHVSSTLPAEAFSFQARGSERAH
jgi:hypothetical protein